MGISLPDFLSYIGKESDQTSKEFQSQNKYHAWLGICYNNKKENICIYVCII